MFEEVHFLEEKIAIVSWKLSDKAYEKVLLQKYGKHHPQGPISGYLQIGKVEDKNVLKGHQ